jgi:protease-4
VEVVELSGEISARTAEIAMQTVEKLNDNPKVKAIVLVVDTPGGGAIASSALYEELSKLRVPVVGWCNSLCASGGMYLLMAPSVKYIGVRNETIAGSIGVIMQITRFNRLLDWAKVDNETYASGSLKDSGSPTRAVKEGEREYLQGIVNELAERFYGVVGKARPKAKNHWAEIKSGRIFIGSQAVRVGLADGVITKEQAILKAKELSGSKLIFTREELKKMSAQAEAGTVYTAPALAPQTSFGDVPWLIETLKEIRQGETVRIEYRMPYKF